MKLQEKDIQDILASYLFEKKHKLIVPNVNLFHWESDLISITNSDFINEYEIKISRGDFKADFKKKKHNILGSRSKKQPNYFYYVTTSKVLKLKELPEYAGFIFIKKGKAILVKKAKLIHNNKLQKREQEYLSRGLMYRYWRYRLSV